ncbi:MAG TPA: PQQ-binding-like beta-propeller repeat protein [Planctomycetota bacterium]|nr:PQQ-binding-like beta-propeller repeat protein [Planctomycetota bacterium]
MRRTSLATLLLVALCFADGIAGNWPGWRGPTGMGTTDEKDLPLKWDGKTGEGILWKAPLKGTTGHSSPIVWGDRVFITTAAKQNREQEEKKEVPEHHLACYQASDGKLLWRTQIPQGKEPAGYAIYAVPTPVTDGKTVYCWFGSAVIAAVDFDGKLLWRHERPGPFVLNPGICQSPILCGDTVILSVDQSRGQGYIQALDKKTGEVKWEQKRPKTGSCNTTPLLLDVKGKTQLIAACENSLQGADPATGEPIWWCKSRAFGESPVAAAGIVYVDKGGNEPAMAVDPTGQGDVAESHAKWRVDKSPGEYSSPVICGDCIYKARKEGEVVCRKLATGEEVFSDKLEKVSKLASPVATADGRVYFVSTGQSHVLKAGPTLEIIGGGTLGGWGNGSSPAVSNGRIFVRDNEFLWCIGAK